MKNRCLFYCYKESSIVVCSIFIICILVISFYIFFFMRFSFSYRYNGYVFKDGDDFYVYILVSDDELKILQNNTLLVEGKIINYDIIGISDDYVYNLKREVYLKFDIEDNKKITNNVLNLVFIFRKTIFEKVKERF